MDPLAVRGVLNNSEARGVHRELVAESQQFWGLPFAFVHCWRCQCLEMVQWRRSLRLLDP